MNAQSALKSYGSVKLDAGLCEADGYRLTQMLFDGFLERVAQAKGAIHQKNIEMRGRKINEASRILLGLKSSLNIEAGGELAENLDALYDYVQRILVQAHAKSDEEKLDECARLINEVATGWREMGEQLKQ